MPAPKRPSAAQLQAQCDAWNAKSPVGTLVSFEAIKGKGETHRGKTTTEAQVMGGHSAVIWLEGKSGCVSLGHCTAIEKAAPAVQKITLKDCGQDFTEWYVRNGIVIDCQPFQGQVWVGTKIVNQQQLEPGFYIHLVSQATGTTTSLNYPVESIVTLCDEEAAKVEEFGRKWAEIKGVSVERLGLEPVSEEAHA